MRVETFVGICTELSVAVSLRAGVLEPMTVAMLTFVTVHGIQHTIVVLMHLMFVMIVLVMVIFMMIVFVVIVLVMTMLFMVMVVLMSLTVCVRVFSMRVAMRRN